MKKHALFVALITGALASAASAQDPTPSATPGVGCKFGSRNPEEYSFYGAKETVGEKVASIPARLSERRVFLQITQGDSSAEVKLYEQQKDGTFTVTEWTTKKSSSLLCAIDEEIFVNKGEDCVGKKVKALLIKKLKAGRETSGVQAPSSPGMAFAPSVERAKGEFIKSTIIILC